MTEGWGGPEAELGPPDHAALLREAAAAAGLAAGAADLRPPASGHVVVHARLRLHYLDWGRPFGGAPVVVFLHGGGLNAHTWDLVCVQLRGGYHCLAVDLRGHGDSEWSPEADYRLEAMAEDIQGLASALGLGRFVLVGQSMGGLVALTYAARWGNALAALALVDVGPELRTEGVARIQRFMDHGTEGESLEAIIQRALRFNPKRDPRRLWWTLRYNLRPLPEGGWMWKYDRRRRDRQRRSPATDEGRRAAWSLVERIACPTLVVRGGESDVFLDADAAKLAGALRDGRWQVVPDAGHNVQGDNPVGLVAALRPFLAAHGR